MFGMSVCRTIQNNAILPGFPWAHAHGTWKGKLGLSQYPKDQKYEGESCWERDNIIIQTYMYVSLNYKKKGAKK